ncbi:MAG: LCP family protein [Clostridia bacterium]
MNKKGISKILIAIIVILLIVLITIGIGIYFVWSKFSKVEYEKLDESNLDVNANLYENVSDKVTKEEFNDVVSVVLFGTDSRDTTNMDAGRSDTIIIASVNPKMKSMKLISIPRDTYVNVPGYGKTKINHAYAYGKEQLSIKTINNNFGLNITEYVTIDFSGLINIINTVGGINMNITEEEMKYINNGVKEQYKITGNPVKKVTHSGSVTLTGEQALTHSRNRTVGNDFTRASRQREVLEALINKMSSMDLNSILSLSDNFLSEVRTNMNPTKYMGLVTSMLTNKSEYMKNFISAQVPNTEYASGQMIDGVYYFVPNMEKAKLDFYTYLFEK